MFCSSCGKNIADDSRFCSYCGKQVVSSAQKVASAGILNTQLPVQIKYAYFGFYGPMEQKSFFMRGKIPGRKYRVAIQLLDKDGEPTAYPGTFRIKVATSAFDGVWDSMKGAIDEEIEVVLSDFVESGNGETIYSYDSEDFIFIDGQAFFPEVKVWFNPKGVKKPLYFQKKHQADIN